MTPLAIRFIALAAGALVAALGGFGYWRSSEKPPVVASAPEPAGTPRPEAASPPAGPSPSAKQVAALPPPPAPAPSTARTAAATAAPQFDIVRVSPDGETLAAGRAPGATRVELLDAGKVIASDKVDQSGQFVLLPPGLSSGDHLLTLRITPDGGQPLSSDQSVAVAVRPGTSPVVTLAEPGKPSVVLASPSPTGATDAPPEAAAAPSPTAQAQIRTAEVEAGGRFYATGNAAPGSTVRLYLNGSHVADASTAADGKWSLTISKGVNAGKYTLRADVVGENDKVISRAEVPFEAPVAVAAAVPRAPAPVQPPAPPVSANPNTGLPGQSALASGPTPTSPAPTGEQAEPAVAASPSASAQAQPMPAHPSASAGPPAGTVVAANGPTSNPIVPEISTATVSHGDSLWRISRVRWGAGKRYTVIYEANAAQIRNPDLIYPGQVLVMPH